MYYHFSFQSLSSNFPCLNSFDRKIFTFCEEKMNTKLLSCSTKDCDCQDHVIFVDQQSSKRHLGHFPKSTASKGISKEVELQHGQTSKRWKTGKTWQEKSQPVRQKKGDAKKEKEFTCSAMASFSPSLALLPFPLPRPPTSCNQRFMNSIFNSQIYLIMDLK